MSVPIYKTAAEVVSAASKERPADTVLRTVLRKQTGLSQTEGREISRAVFSYYRWCKWLDPQTPLESQIRQAEDRTLRFRERPEIVTDEELLQAVPAWVAQKMDASAPWRRALQAEPRLWLRARRGHAGYVLSSLRTADVGPLPDSILFQSEEDLFRLPQFHDGLFELQDLSSQAVGLICDPKPGETWWDACAGEGGKTLHLSDIMGNKGLIWATDKAEWRLKQLKLRAGRAHCFNYRSKVWSNSTTLPTKTLFDGVLVDAPCSGVGTWQRNPHARWTTTERDINELAAIQRNLLFQAAAAVKKGGRLIYSVCTLTWDETRDVADAFEREHPEFVAEPFSNPFKPEDQQARLFLWPQTVQANGMYIAAWKRV